MLRRLKYWFTNVFWYHYRIHTIVVLAVTALVTMFVYDILTVVTPDFTYVFASVNLARDQDLDKISDTFAKRIGDVNNDKKEYVNGMSIYLGDPTDATGIQRLGVYMADEDISVFIVDPAMRNYWEDTRILLDVSQYGIKTAEDNKYLADVSDSPMFSQAIRDGGKHYAIVMKAQNEKQSQQQELAVDFLRMLQGP